MEIPFKNPHKIELSLNAEFVKDGHVKKDRKNRSILWSAPQILSKNSKQKCHKIVFISIESFSDPLFLEKKLGFDLVRITTAEPFYGDESEALKRIRDGHMDGLSWYTEDRVIKMNRPGLLLEGAKSIISVGISYLEQDRESEKLLSGRVSRYARGADYHSVLKLRLKKFRDAVSDILGKNLNTRIYQSYQ